MHHRNSASKTNSSVIQELVLLKSTHYKSLLWSYLFNTLECHLHGHFIGRPVSKYNMKDSFVTSKQVICIQYSLCARLLLQPQSCMLPDCRDHAVFSPHYGLHVSWKQPVITQNQEV